MSMKYLRTVAALALAGAISSVAGCSDNRPKSLEAYQSGPKAVQSTQMQDKMGDCYSEIREGFVKYAEIVRKANPHIKKEADILSGTKIRLPEQRILPEGVVHGEEVLTIGKLKIEDIRDVVIFMSSHSGRESKCFGLSSEESDQVRNIYNGWHVWE